MEASGPRRQRVQALPPVARARKTSKEEEVLKVFQEIDVAGHGKLSLRDLCSYVCDFLGFGLAEAEAIFKAGGASGADDSVDFAGFRKSYALLNPFSLADRREEVIIRKPGSLCGQMVTLDGLEDCDVYVCDVTAQVMMDYCKRCRVLFAPCESSVFVRNCEDCSLWLAVQQLRTRDCQRCTFHLYAKTEPIIETSEDMAFAPWAARYPKCISQFMKAGFDPHKNLWNAIFDFTPGSSGCSNWRILPLQEVTELVLELDEAPEAAANPDSPLGPVTHDQLCAAPIKSGESAGASVANIVQIRPSLPSPPPEGTVINTRAVQDVGSWAAAVVADGKSGAQGEAAAEKVDVVGQGMPDKGMEMRVCASKGVGFYLRASKAFLCGIEAREGKEMRPPVDELCLCGVGNALGVASAVATRLTEDGVGCITKIKTLFPEMPNGRRVAQILIWVRRIEQ